MGLKGLGGVSYAQKYVRAIIGFLREIIASYRVVVKNQDWYFVEIFWI